MGGPPRETDTETETTIGRQTDRVLGFKRPVNCTGSPQDELGRAGLETGRQRQ